MSIRIMTLAWDVQGLRHTEKLVLLALADNANDEGHCWPSITTLAAKCSMSRRAVIYAIADLEKARHLTRSGDGGKVTSYNIHPCKPCTSAGDAPVQEMHATRASRALVPVHLVHPTRASGAPRTIIEPSYEPSLNHHTEGGSVVSGQDVPRGTVDRFDGWTFVDKQLRPVYPRGSFRHQHWLNAARMVERLVSEGGADPAAIAKNAAAYCAQVESTGRAGTRFVMSPTTFLTDNNWQGPFELPAEPESKGNSTAAKISWRPDPEEERRAQSRLAGGGA